MEKIVKKGKEFISNGKLEAAIMLIVESVQLESINNEAILWLGRLRTLKVDSANGTISMEYQTLEKNRIGKAILELLTNLKLTEELIKGLPNHYSRELHYPSTKKGNNLSNIICLALHLKTSNQKIKLYVPSKTSIKNLIKFLVSEIYTDEYKDIFNWKIETNGKYITDNLTIFSSGLQGGDIIHLIGENLHPRTVCAKDVGDNKGGESEFVTLLNKLILSLEEAFEALKQFDEIRESRYIEKELIGIRRKVELIGIRRKVVVQIEKIIQEFTEPIVKKIMEFDPNVKENLIILKHELSRLEHTINEYIIKETKADGENKIMLIQIFLTKVYEKIEYLKTLLNEMVLELQSKK